jgi:P27 family predicted phage terminase small subunit
MKTGRKPKPFLLKLTEGNRGHRKLKPGADLPAGPFESPFPLDGIARSEWNRIVAAAYWFRETDSAAIADRCLCFQRMLEAEQDIRDRGAIVRTRNGKVTNPSIRIARAYRLSIQRYDAELGLTASSRGRVDVDGAVPMMPTQIQRRPIDPLEDALCGPIPN